MFWMWKYDWLTNGNAAKYFINVVLNLSRSMAIMVLSIIVTLWIIHISLTDRATNDPAIRNNNDVSTLHTPGIIIPANCKWTMNNEIAEIHLICVLFGHFESYVLGSCSFTWQKSKTNEWRMVDLGSHLNAVSNRRITIKLALIFLLFIIVVRKVKETHSVDHYYYFWPQLICIEYDSENTTINNFA